MSATPVTEIIGKIVADYHTGTYPDRDQKRFAFYERLHFEADAFEKWLNQVNPFYELERYSDEPVTYCSVDTHQMWEKWLGGKSISLADEYR